MLAIRSIIEWAQNSLQNVHMSSSEKEEMFLDVYNFSQKVLYQHLKGGWLYRDFDMVSAYALHCWAYGLWLHSKEGSIPLTQLHCDTEDLLHTGEAQLNILCSLPEHDILSAWIAPDVCKKYWSHACSATPPIIETFMSYFMKHWRYQDLLTELAIKRQHRERMWQDWCALSRLSGAEGKPCDHVMYFIIQRILLRNHITWKWMCTVSPTELASIIADFSQEVQEAIRHVWQKLCLISPELWDSYKGMEFCLVDQSMQASSHVSVDWKDIKEKLGLKILAVLIATDGYEHMQSIPRWRDAVSDLRMCDSDMVPHIISELQSAGLLNKKEETYLKNRWVADIDEWIGKPKHLWT